MTAYTDDDVQRARGCGVSSDGVRAILAAVAPQIAARALREAADEMAHEDWCHSSHTDCCGGECDCNVAWLRARAEQVGDGPHYQRYIDGNHCPKCAEHVERNAVGDWPPDEPDVEVSR